MEGKFNFFCILKHQNYSLKEQKKNKICDWIG